MELLTGTAINKHPSSTDGRKKHLKALFEMYILATFSCIQ
jgi:hypothetical protein